MSGTSSRKPFRIISYTLLAILALIVILSGVLSMVYEKAMVRYMKKYLDEHLLTELSMDEIRFRVLRGFPYATVEITDVVVLSGKDFSHNDFPSLQSDTLLQANSVILQFDLLKLLRKSYELRKIEIVHGSLNILFDNQNRHNLRIWRSSANTAAQDYVVNLRSILLNSIQIQVQALRPELNLMIWSEKTNFKGTFSNNLLSGDTRSSLTLRELSIKNHSWLQNASLQLDAKMVYSGKRIRVSQGKIQLNKASAQIAGEFKGGKKSWIDMTLNIPRFGLGELMSLMPPSMKSWIEHYHFTGNGKLNLTIRGSFPRSKDLLIRSAFELHNGTARNPQTKTSVNKISMEGTVSGTSRESFSLQLDAIHGEIGKGTIDGKFSLRNLNTLLFYSELQSSLDLGALKKFAGLDTLEKLSGSVRSDFIASGSLKYLSANSLVQVFTYIQTGTFVFENAGMKIRNVPLTLDQMTGKTVWKEHIRLDSLQVRINETDFLINGTVQHLPAFLQKQAILRTDLQVMTEHLDISKYLNQPSGNKSEGYKSLSLFPEDIYLKAQVKAGHFMAGKFRADQVSLHISALKDSVYIHDFSLKFPDGSISGDALISGNARTNFSITCNARPSRINIQQLFSAFNNFTQHFIVDKNMKGHLSGSIGFFARWDSTLKLITPDIRARGEFEITDGELLQFDPLLKLSKYIDVEELRHIRFSTLKNTISISDRVVTIPEMAIHSSAFNISVSGQHSFDNQFDYHVKVLLSEVLFNKARKKKKEMDEFLVEETRGDQTTIPLIIEGTPDQYDVRFDKKKAFSLTRNNLKKDAQDSQLTPSAGNFRIEWEEPADSVSRSSKSRQSPSDFVIEWDDE